jgi:hypothetical protein
MMKRKITVSFFLHDNCTVYEIRIMYTCDPVMRFSLCDVITSIM